VLFSDEVCGKEKPFVVVDSRVNESSNRQEIHVLLLWVDQVKEQDEHVTFVTKLEWIVLSEGADILEINERPYSNHWTFMDDIHCVQLAFGVSQI
jgi:hypothetical protein